jgi:hypothetical protein
LASYPTVPWLSVILVVGLVTGVPAATPKPATDWSLPTATDACVTGSTRFQACGAAS